RAPCPSRTDPTTRSSGRIRASGISMVAPVPSRIVILDFGAQYTQVIARRVRECQVFSQILRYDTPAADIAALRPDGLILSGGPASVYGQDAPHPDPAIFELGLPILGICY